MENRSNSNLNPSKPSKTTPSSGGHTLEVSSLQVNTQLEEDIFDKRGILMLAAGATITERFLGQLRRHHITTVTAKSSKSSKSPFESIELIELFPTYRYKFPSRPRKPIGSWLSQRYFCK